MGARTAASVPCCKRHSPFRDTASIRVYRLWHAIRAMPARGQLQSAEGTSEQHDVVLLLRHGAFALETNRFSDEVGKTSEVLAFFVEEQLDHLG